jgi:predicted transcriptional regulator of viral defense system
MSMRDELRKIAKANSGLVTTKDVKTAGFTTSALRQYVLRHDDISALGNGAHIDESVIPEAYEDMYCLAAMKIAGKGSYLRGSSVLDFYHLGYAAPRKIQVSTPGRVKARVPEWMDVTRDQHHSRVDEIRGIRLQPVRDAILASHDMKRSDLLTAVEQAAERNLISPDAIVSLTHTLKHGER